MSDKHPERVFELRSDTVTRKQCVNAFSFTDEPDSTSDLLAAWRSKLGVKSDPVRSR